MLESYLEERLREKEILLMTHIVVGYPTLEDSLRVVETMVESGVDLMELQIPFSEPIADGPVILQANQKALAGGASVSRCLDFAEQVAKAFDIPFLIMTYYNILFKYGVERFAARMSECALAGAIIPDLPPEEGADYLEAMSRYDLSPIFIFSPRTTDRRMAYLASFARGFVYCVARKGVTGQNTDFSRELDHYLVRCRKATRLPLALGFGVKGKADIDSLRGKADIAVIGSQMIRLMNEEGIDALGAFIGSLR